MKLTLKRRWPKETYTIGELYIDGQYFCNTLEDKVRDLNKNGKFDNGEVKIYKQTAIPYGTYKITLNVISPSLGKKEWAKPYGGKIPRLLNVPSFEGILIHPGNTANATAGCILVGENKVKGRLVNSVETFHKLMTKLKGQKDLTIEII